MFCPKELDIMTNFDCGKSIYAEKNLVKSLNQIINKKFDLILKLKNIDRAWGFIDKAGNVRLFTYDLVYLKIEDILIESIVKKLSIQKSKMSIKK